MTTTQGRLLVTCVGGFACTEWELHNRLNTERVFGSDQQFELRMKFMNLVMEQLQSVWWKMVRWLHFFSHRLSSHILTHYVVSVDLATAPVQRLSAVAEEMSLTCPVLQMKPSWHPLTDPKPLVFLPEGENPSILCGAAPRLRQSKLLMA